MTEKITGNQQGLPFRMQLNLPEGGATITITTGNTAPADSREIDRVSPINVVRHYPQEPTIQPSIVTNYIESYRQFGDEHSDTIAAWEELREALLRAKSRDFQFDRFNRDFEGILWELRSKLEGKTMGEERSVISQIRERVLEEAITIFDTPKERDSSKAS